ncbi:DUF4132 domain-containing protein [Nocardioides sp. NPDC051685]|uniref:DUF4132 domain-containing protein n=1 Tax=Nocardioides sp. NPDC051685 TaxID=3364334 RepID=UPI0037B2B090
MFGKFGERGDKAWRKSLKQVTKAFEQADDAADYVLTGSNPGLLAHLASNRNYAVDSAAIGEFYKAFEEVEADQLQRWASLNLAAGARGGYHIEVIGQVGGSHWLAHLVTHAFLGSRPDQPLTLRFADVVRIAEVFGASVTEVLDAMLELPQYARYRGKGVRKALTQMPGLAEALAAHPATVERAFLTGTVDRRLAAIDLVATTLGDALLARLAAVVANAATGTSRQVRESAVPVLKRVAPESVSALRDLAVSGKPEQRAEALTLLLDLPGEREWALETAAADRAERVRGVAAAAVEVADEPDVELESFEDPVIDWSMRADAAAELAKKMAAGFNEAQARWAAQVNRRAGVHRQVQAQAYRASDVKALESFLASSSSPRIDQLPSNMHATLGNWWETRTLLLNLVGRENVAAAGRIKLLLAMSGFRDVRDNGYRFSNDLMAVLADEGTVDLLSISVMVDECGGDGIAVVWRGYAGGAVGRRWDVERVRPFVTKHLDRILQLDSQWQSEYWYSNTAIYAAAAALPRLPRGLREHIYGVALGTRKADRPYAQAAIATDPERLTRAVAALGDGRAEIRAVAATWLARIGDTEALPGLQAAWKKERNDLVRGAVLDALVALGESAETYLDPVATAKAAEKVVAKGLPKPLAWVAWESAPEVKFASTGDPVPLSVIQWLCVVAVKAKSAEPNAILRQYAALFERGSRERLGAWLLNAWLVEDVTPISREEAEQQAAQHAGWGSWQRNSAESRFHGMTVEQHAAALLPGFLKQPKGSAIASKGLLAVAAACAGGDVVPPTERYLREWFGQRAAQGKALIGMLAWIEDPAATQLMLSIGNRFRTKSFQEEATNQAHALAERRGWTVDELADRTIPSAGFDDDGRLELSYGERVFTAALQPDLTIVLNDPDGKRIKSLPAGRKTDDEDAVKAAKKAFTAAKKELKTVGSLQQARLYEALCTERTWVAQDWQTYLAGHPVVRHAVARLVWLEVVGDGTGVDSFRPFRLLDDGSLTDAEGEEVTLAAGSRVRIAHASLLTEDQVEAWREHLADYEITPLFDQLGRGVHTLTEEAAKGRDMADFEGHMLEAYALRGLALKLGYVRGETEDAGWFYSYDKRYPTLDLVARIGFTGNFLPEENRQVALERITFHRISRDGGRDQLTLGEVPAVLASETWHDARAIAAAGTGFAADWQKRSEY